MSKVKIVTKYVLRGIEYSSLKKVQESVITRFGEEFLDRISKECPLEKHKDYFKLMDLLCSKDIIDLLNECLNVTCIIPGEEEEEDREINILDLKILKKVDMISIAATSKIEAVYIACIEYIKWYNSEKEK